MEEDFGQLQTEMEEGTPINARTTHQKQGTVVGREGRGRVERLSLMYPQTTWGTHSPV